MITQEELKDLVQYDPDTGILIRLFAVNRWKVGSVMGTSDKDGYRVTDIKGKKYKIHRVAWFYVHGVWPNIIDHLDGDPANNRINNLRNTDCRGNAINRKLQANNTSGVCGVYWHKGNEKWSATMKENGKLIHLGYFSEFEDAVTARAAAEMISPDHKALKDLK